jgi:hypothetical protein
MAQVSPWCRTNCGRLLPRVSGWSCICLTRSWLTLCCVTTSRSSGTSTSGIESKKAFRAFMYAPVSPSGSIPPDSCMWCRKGIFEYTVSRACGRIEVIGTTLVGSESFRSGL